MGADIVSPFSRSAALANQPLEDVTAACQDLLDCALRGEIRGVAMAYVDGSGAVVMNWAGGDASGNLMISATAQLAHRTNNRLLNEEGD